MTTIWFEDTKIGTEIDFGHHLFRQAEMRRFIDAFGPHPMQREATDLLANPWHVTAAWMGLAAAVFSGKNGNNRAAMGSPGVRDIRWGVPVKVGDEVHFQSISTEKIQPRSRPDFGILRSQVTGRNQHGELVLEFTGQGMIATRPNA